MYKIVVFFVFALLVWPGSAQQGSKNFIDQPFIEVRGLSEMEIIPDMIYLKVVINEQDTKGKVSLERQETQMMATLEKIGLDGEEFVFLLILLSFYRIF